MIPLGLAIILTIAVIASIDFLPRLYLTKKSPLEAPIRYDKVPEYLILPTVYGDISYLKNIDFLKKYRKNVIILTSQNESLQFYKDLRKVCRQNGFRYRTVNTEVINGYDTKNPYTIYRSAFINDVLPVKNSTPCLLIDADTYSNNNINHAIRSFLKSNTEVASLRCEVSNPLTIIQKLQQVEYKLAMDNRTFAPWLTSGACNISTKKIYRHIFSMHSKFFAGGDVEIGTIANISGYKVNHINFTFLTEAPDTFLAWFKQRIIWFAGGVRMHLININNFNWLNFFLFLYNSLFIYLLLPIRWWFAVKYPILIPFIASISLLYLCILLGRKNWQIIYLLLPIYSMIQTMIILPIALYKYATMAYRNRALGYIKYDLARYSRSLELTFKTLNIANTGMILILAAAITTRSLSILSHL